MHLTRIFQSRRDCVLQPRVARNELPWESPREREFSTLKGLRQELPKVSEQRNPEATTLSGLEPRANRAPRVARSSQPWALGRNPFGILLRQSQKIRVRYSRKTALQTLRESGCEKTGWRGLTFDFARRQASLPPKGPGRLSTSDIYLLPSCAPSLLPAPANPTFSSL